MDPLTMGLVTGGASLLGSIFQGSTSASNTQAQIQANQQMVAQQEQFQQQMSSTAYQRASADMKAAGLNPMMMFGSGSGASTPGGASISQTVNRQSPFAGLGDAATKMVSSAVQAKTFDKMTDEIANLKSENELINRKADLVREEAAGAHERVPGIAAETSAKQLALPSARFGAKTSEDLLDVDDAWRRNMVKANWYGQKTSGAMAPALDTVSSATGAGRLFKDIWKDRVDRGY